MSKDTDEPSGSAVASPRCFPRVVQVVRPRLAIVGATGPVVVAIGLVGLSILGPVSCGLDPLDLLAGLSTEQSGSLTTLLIIWLASVGLAVFVSVIYAGRHIPERWKLRVRTIAAIAAIVGASGVFYALPMIGVAGIVPDPEVCSASNPSWWVNSVILACWVAITFVCVVGAPVLSVIGWIPRAGVRGSSQDHHGNSTHR